ncbi:hypothetical protein BY996DRAFT_6412564 [Phakopsora pachyrhizi]|nr:hypothetical protein BY996DRAFT_6412564 [Phakopsora pachyrhizi]
MDVGDKNRNNKADEGGVSLGLPELFLNSADPMNGFNAAYWGLVSVLTAANGKRGWSKKGSENSLKSTAASEKEKASEAPVDHELSSSLAANTSLRVNKNN